MAILDSKGRLFGKLSLLDLGAALAIFMVVFGIFFYPGATGSIAQSNVTKQAVEVDVIARGLTVLNPEQFLADLATTTETKIIVRNQPYGDSGADQKKSWPSLAAWLFLNRMVALNPIPILGLS